MKGESTFDLPVRSPSLDITVDYILTLPQITSSNYYYGHIDSSPSIVIH